MSQEANFDPFLPPYEGKDFDLDMKEFKNTAIKEMNAFIESCIKTKITSLKERGNRKARLKWCSTELLNAMTTMAVVGAQELVQRYTDEPDDIYAARVEELALGYVHSIEHMKEYIDQIVLMLFLLKKDEKKEKEVEMLKGLYDK